MSEIYWRGGSILKPSMFMEARVSRHKRSKSDLAKRKAEEDKMDNIQEASNSFKPKEMGERKHSDQVKKMQPHKSEVQNSLKQEIQQLQESLKDQFVVRHAFENALSYRPFSFDSMTDTIPRDAKELIKEIAVLELEVVYLEQYILSLYRKTFDERITSQSTEDDRMKSATATDKGMFSEVSRSDIASEKVHSFRQTGNAISCGFSSDNPLKESNDYWQPQKLLDSGIHRSHSSLSQHSACSLRTSPPLKSLAKAVDSYHSLPLSMLEKARADTSSGISLAKHLGTSVSEHIPETPNWLSEEMIKSISDIYCELADPPLMIHDCPFSPISNSSSSLELLSLQGQGDIWSPQHGRFSSFNSHCDNPFSNGESKEFSGPYCTLAKVEKLRRDDQKLKDIEHKLQYYRSLVYRLEEVDPRRMKHEHKLAFWINVHNALVMHAYLVYGVPKNNLKRISLLLKAAYNIGGQTINVDMIQSSILGCRMPRPGQWLRFLFSSRVKFKTGDARRAYTIEHPEPRLHFALCSGSYSDPVVRLYTPKRVFQDLEIAKEEYIQSNFSINKEQKIILPKIVDSFAKDSDICQAGLLDMVEQILPDSLKKKNIQKCQQKKSGKIIEWIPHNFAFRFLLAKELA